MYNYKNTVRYKYYHQNKPFKQVTSLTDIDSFSMFYYGMIQSLIFGHEIKEENAMQGAEDICIILLKQNIKPYPSNMLKYLYDTIKHLDNYIPIVESLFKLNNLEVNFTEKEEVYLNFLKLQALEI